MSTGDRPTISIGMSAADADNCMTERTAKQTRGDEERDTAHSEVVRCSN